MSWSVLQSASNTVNTGTTVGATYGTNLTAGSTMIAAVMAGPFSATTTSVKDGAGNSFLAIASQAVPHLDGSVSLWALNTPSGDAGTKPTITATASGGTNDGYAILIQEVSGIITSGTGAGFTDGTAGTTSGTTQNGSIGPPSYTSTQTSEYLVYVLGNWGNGSTWTAPGGYTSDAHGVENTFSTDLQIAYKNSTAGAETGQYSLSGSFATDWGLILVAFKLASVARTATASLTVTPSFTAGVHHVQPVPTGSWWGLDSVFKQSRQEFESYVSRPPMACPVCGEPLTYAPATKAGSGVERFCKFDGWQYPRDHIPPSRPMPW